ncbi:chemotaxis protein CheX [Candidatus Poribacteria bacterium]|nr:chemotaxis protein CheX [Candidatus Poribacteria bacterium]
MRAEYINPFVAALENFCEMMLGCKVERGKLKLANSALEIEHPDVDQAFAKYDITALIGLSGKARGTVALLFPAKTALMITRRFLETDKIFKIDDTVIDAVAEMVNIVAGSAKRQLSDELGLIKLSLPTVVRGRNFEIKYPTGSVWLQIPFNSTLGPFFMQVSFEKIDE